MWFKLFYNWWIALIYDGNMQPNSKCCTNFVVVAIHYCYLWQKQSWKYAFCCKRKRNKCIPNIPVYWYQRLLLLQWKAKMKNAFCFTIKCRRNSEFAKFLFKKGWLRSNSWIKNANFKICSFFSPLR